MKITFRLNEEKDKAIITIFDTIPTRERSEVIRRIIRKFFGISDSSFTIPKLVEEFSLPPVTETFVEPMKNPPSEKKEEISESQVDNLLKQF